MATRTSREAASTSRSGVTGLPSARQARSRRRMFSMSMMASSTTTPTATANPASTIVLMVEPTSSSTTAAVTSDSGIASRLTSAARPWNRNASSTNTTRMQPRITDRPRLPIAVWMNAACRKMPASTWTKITSTSET